MTIIEAQVKDQELKVTTEPLVASGGINETTIHFSFCENWTNFVKTAVFADAGKENWYNVVLDANKAVVPAQVTATKGRFWFGVVGVKDQTRYTTKIVQYDIVEGAVLAIEDVEPPQAMIDQILASVGAHTANMENPHQVTKEQLGLGNVDNTADKDKTVKHAGTADNAMKDNFGKVISEAYATRKEIKTCPSGVPVKDDSVAYIKNVPSNSLPAAKINKIGGMTRKCTNWFDIAKAYDGDNMAINNGVFTQITADTNAYLIFKCLTYNGSTLVNDEIVQVKSIGRVSVKLEKTEGVNRIVFGMNGSSIDSVASADIAHIPSGQYILSIDFTNITQGSISWRDVTINEGTEPLPYEPYFEGLRSAPVTEVESVGANIFRYPYTDTTKTVNGITFTDNGDGTITANGTATGSAAFVIRDKFELIARKDYFLSGSPNVGGCSICLNEANAVASSFIENGNGILINTGFPNRICIAQIESGTTVNNVVFKPMLNKGSTALPYTPYTKNTLEIPEAVRPKNGINENVYDHIDFEKKQFVQRVGVVDMGTLNWTYSTIFTATVSGRKIGNSNLICSNYSTATVTGTALMGDGTILGNAVMESVYVKDSNYTDTTAFKNAMIGVMLYYELATPIVTDISDILPADNFIGVEGGGTLTFKNEYEYDVPSEVINYLNAASGVIVDGNPALKVGDTIITEAQLTALLGLIT